MEGKRILVIDDDADLVELVRIAFAHAGAEVYSALDGREGLFRFGECHPDLILLDVMMPDLNGWETCRLFREFTDVPIIFLTALSEEAEVVRGLDCGAVDYVAKPFSPKVLLARARVALRVPAQAARSHKTASFDDGYLVVDGQGRRVLVAGEPVQLTLTEFRLLAYLSEHAGQVLTYEQILAHVWGREYTDSTDYVHVYVSHLRRKIEWDASRPAYIVNERGVGYRFSGTNL